MGSFEDLFSNFEHLKRTAAGLPPDQRRDFAENVAVAFWRAMGGDEDEVTGLDSDGDIWGWQGRDAVTGDKILINKEIQHEFHKLVVVVNVWQSLEETAILHLAKWSEIP